jgi:hypothetical protein
VNALLLALVLSMPPAIIDHEAIALMEPEGCVTDSECFIQCEKELGRKCTDEDVFGPVYPEEDHIQGEDGPCQDLPLDHPDHCEEGS